MIRKLLDWIYSLFPQDFVDGQMTQEEWDQERESREKQFDHIQREAQKYHGWMS